MKHFISLSKWLWWFSVGYIPVALFNLERQFMESIGCPPAGDCYVPGSEILLDFDILVIGLAIPLWPVCFWFLSGRYLFIAFRRRPIPHSSGTAQKRAAP